MWQIDVEDEFSGLIVCCAASTHVEKDRNAHIWHDHWWLLQPHEKSNDNEGESHEKSRSRPHGILVDVEFPRFHAFDIMARSPPWCCQERLSGSINEELAGALAVPNTITALVFCFLGWFAASISLDVVHLRRAGGRVDGDYWIVLCLRQRIDKHFLCWRKGVGLRDSQRVCIW